MERAILAKGARSGTAWGAGLASVFGAFAVLPGMLVEQRAPSLAVDAASIVAIGSVVGLLHGLVLGFVAAFIWSAVRPRVAPRAALDLVALAVAATMPAVWVGLAGPDAAYAGLLLGVAAGAAARLGVRDVMVRRDDGLLRPSGYQVRGRIYVETRMRAPFERVWALTQDPAQHARWDLRFGRIEPEGNEAGAPRFRYSTFTVAGQGVHVGDRRRASSGATSSLRFASSHPLSPIAEGAGYWRYEPAGTTLRFLTGYDYRPRYPRIDSVFRPLMGWATAWSFDRLRLWAERGQGPGRSLGLALADLAMRLGAVVVAGVVGDVLTAVAAAILMRWVPAPARVPSANRCLRRPPDARSATAPQALATLEGI